MKKGKKKQARRDRGYAARLARRYREFGPGPNKDHMGKPLPPPRPCCELLAWGGAVGAAAVGGAANL